MTCPRCAFSNQAGVTNCVNCGAQILVNQPSGGIQQPNPGVTQMPQASSQVPVNQLPVNQVSVQPVTAPSVEELIIEPAPVVAQTVTQAVPTVTPQVDTSSQAPVVMNAAAVQANTPVETLQTNENTNVTNEVAAIQGSTPEPMPVNMTGINDSIPNPSETQIKPVVGMRPPVVEAKKPNNPVVVAILIIALIVLIGIGAWQIFGGKENPIPTPPTDEETQNIDDDADNFALNSDISNYRFMMSSVMIMNILGEDIEMNITAEGIMDELNQRQYAVMKTSTMGFEEETTIYSDFKESITFAQVALYEVWSKTAGASAIAPIKDIIAQFETIDSLTEISENIYQLKMTNEQINALINTVDSEISNVNITEDVFAVIHVNDGYITHIEYDFSNYAEGISTFTITMDFTDFNIAGEITIPQDVIDNATEM